MPPYLKLELGETLEADITLLQSKLSEKETLYESFQNEIIFLFKRADATEDENKKLVFLSKVDEYTDKQDKLIMYMSTLRHQLTVDEILKKMLIYL